MSKENIAELQDQRIIERSIQLIDACVDRDVETVQKLLDEGDVDINWQGHDHWNLQGKTPLIAAADTGSAEIIELLLNHKNYVVDVDLQDSRGNTALILSSANQKNLELILAKNPNINLQNKNGETALIKACMFTRDNSKVINTLLAAGAEVNLQNNKGESALICTIGNAGLENVEALLKMGANPNLQDEKGRTALIVACQKGCNSSQYYSYSDQNHRDQNIPFANSIINRVSKIVTNLVEAGAEIDIRDNEKKTALMHSCRYINSGERGESDYARKYAPILDKEAKLSEYLLEQGANPHLQDQSGKSLIIIANQNSNVRCVDALLKYGANEFDLKRLTPEYKYLIDQEDTRNISCTKWSQWDPLAKAMVKGIENSKLGNNEYPCALVNKDNSVSFFVADEERNPKSLITNYNADFKEVAGESWVSEQLEYRSKEVNLEKIGGKKILETTSDSTTGITEYKFNLAPESLDTILKLNLQYTGYKNASGVLSLVKDFTPKKGSIRLFPIVPIDEEHQENFVQAAGCQVYEMPTVQLLRLLPNYQEEILPQHKKTGAYFHWIPKEVSEELCLDNKDVRDVMLKVFSNNGIAVTEGNGDFQENPEYLKIKDGSKQSSVNIAPMDDEAKQFYQIYGNCSAAELDNCLSVEVKTTDFLQEIKNNLEVRVANGRFSQERLDAAKMMVGKMIEREAELQLEEEIDLGQIELLDKNNDEEPAPKKSPSPSPKNPSATKVVERCGYVAIS